MTENSDLYPYLIESPGSLPARFGTGPGGRTRTTWSRLDPGVPLLAFYCVGSQSGKPHRDAPWFIGCFERTGSIDAERWLVSRLYPTRSGFGFPLGDKHVEEIVADAPRDRSDPLATSDPQFRVRYVFDCKVCALKEVRRVESAQDDLDTLYEHGGREVSLEGYQRFLRLQRGRGR